MEPTLLTSPPVLLMSGLWGGKGQQIHRRQNVCLLYRYRASILPVLVSEVPLVQGATLAACLLLRLQRLGERVLALGRERCVSMDSGLAALGSGQINCKRRTHRGFSLNSKTLCTLCSWKNISKETSGTSRNSHLETRCELQPWKTAQGLDQTAQVRMRGGLCTGRACPQDSQATPASALLWLKAPRQAWKSLG